MRWTDIFRTINLFCCSINLIDSPRKGAKDERVAKPGDNHKPNFLSSPWCYCVSFKTEWVFCFGIGFKTCDGSVCANRTHRSKWICPISLMWRRARKLLFFFFFKQSTQNGEGRGRGGGQWVGGFLPKCALMWPKSLKRMFGDRVFSAY